MSSIPLSNLHRRQSRDNGSESDGRPAAHETAELDQPLLDQDDRSDLDTPIERRHRGEQNIAHHCLPGQKYLMIGSAAVLFFFILVALAALHTAAPQKRPEYTFEPGSLAGSLGILLSPRKHIDRAPGDVKYAWNITSGERAPDGVQKTVYLINGQFPGPLIECRPGDHLHILVTNGLSNPNESISIHWHGIKLKNLNEMDGASSFTQCPIPPGKSFIYSFIIDDESVGTFWYHAHSGVQRGDGMYGGLVVHDRYERERELQRYPYGQDVLLLIGDWYHRDAGEVLDWYMSVRGFKNEVRFALLLPY
jgi:FtsP/CotA-like multicopper oxidase with cupredoxin domain